MLSIIANIQINAKWTTRRTHEIFMRKPADKFQEEADENSRFLGTKLFDKNLTGFCVVEKIKKTAQL